MYYVEAEIYLSCVRMLYDDIYEVTVRVEVFTTHTRIHENVNHIHTLINLISKILSKLK